MKKKRTNPYKDAGEAFLAEKAKEEGLIMGWQIALTRMHEGDKWEVYIPAHSTLIFTLRLFKIER